MLVNLCHAVTIASSVRLAKGFDILYNFIENDSLSLAVIITIVRELIWVVDNGQP